MPHGNHLPPPISTCQLVKHDVDEIIVLQLQLLSGVICRNVHASDHVAPEKSGNPDECSMPSSYLA